MNKRELIARVKHHLGVGATRETATDALNTVLDCIKRAAEDGRLQLRGFGSFYTKEVKEHTRLNPKTGETIFVPSKQKLSFKAADFKEPKKG